MKKVLVMVLCIGQIVMVSGAGRPVDIVFHPDPVGQPEGPRPDPVQERPERGLLNFLRQSLARLRGTSTGGSGAAKRPVDPVDSKLVEIAPKAPVAAGPDTVLEGLSPEDVAAIRAEERSTINFANRVRSLFGRESKKTKFEQFNSDRKKLTTDIEMVDYQIKVRNAEIEKKGNRIINERFQLLMKEIDKLEKLKIKLNKKLENLTAQLDKIRQTPEYKEEIRPKNTQYIKNSEGKKVDQKEVSRAIEDSKRLFLEQAGYSKKDADKFLKDLLAEKEKRKAFDIKATKERTEIREEDKQRYPQYYGSRNNKPV